MVTGNESKHNSFAGSLYAILSAIIFGFTPLLAKSLYNYGFTSFSIAFARFFIGSVYLLILIKIQHKNKILLPKKQLLHILIISVFYAFMIILLYSSYDYIDSGVATTLHFSYPVFVILISAIFYKKVLDVNQMICTILALLGILFLNDSSMSMNGIGAVAAVLSGLSYALYIVLAESFEVNDLPLFVLSFWISVFSTMTVSFSFLFAPIPQARFNINSIVLLALIALATNVFALGLFQKGLSLCGGVKASLLSTFEPLTSVFVGLFVYRERLTMLNIIGIIFILLATVILVIKKHEEK